MSPIRPIAPINPINPINPIVKPHLTKLQAAIGHLVDRILWVHNIRFLVNHLGHTTA